MNIKIYEIAGAVGRMTLVALDSLRLTLIMDMNTFHLVPIVFLDLLNQVDRNKKCNNQQNAMRS